MIDVKRGILVFGCAVAFAATPLIVASPASACPYGTVESFAGVCTAGGQGGGPVVPPAASPPGAVVNNSFNGYGSVNGIPCTPMNYGKCIALQQSQG
jgi:hypothetical protein